MPDESLTPISTSRPSVYGTFKTWMKTEESHSLTSKEVDRFQAFCETAPARTPIFDFVSQDSASFLPGLSSPEKLSVERGKRTPVSISRRVRKLYRVDTTQSIIEGNEENFEGPEYNDSKNLNDVDESVVYDQTSKAKFWRKVNEIATWTCPSYTPFLFRVTLFNLGVASVFLAILKIIGEDDWITGNTWFATLPLSHWTLTFAWWFLCTSYFVADIAILRLLLSVACWFFVMFGIIGIPGAIGVDAIIYNLFMTIMNIWLGLNVIWERRHVDFDTEFEIVYQEIFSLYIDRHLFGKLVDIALIRQCHKGEFFNDIGDPVTDVTVILDGKVSVITRSGNCMVQLNRFDICEASEWIAHDMNPLNAKHTFSYRCDSDVRILRWPRELVMKLMLDNPQLTAHMLAVLAISTTQMLYRVDGQQTMQPSYDAAGASPNFKRDNVEKPIAYHPMNIASFDPALSSESSGEMLVKDDILPSVVTVSQEV